MPTTPGTGSSTAFAGHLVYCGAVVIRVAAMLFYVIDDDRSVSSLIASVLRKVPGAEIAEFEAAEPALQALQDLMAQQAELPVLIITDIQLPGLSGVNFCQWLKSHQMLAEIPVILISGSDGEEGLKEAFSVGAHDFIRKPIRVYELEVRIQAAVRLSMAGSIRRSAMAMAEKELFFNQAIISSISNMGVGLLVIDKRRIAFVNPAFCKLTGYAESELYAWPHFLPIFHPDEHPRIHSNHERRLRGETIETRYETALQCKDGGRLDVAFSVSLWQAAGHDGVICLVRDIREELSMRQRLRDMAERDALTGLPNRRLLQDRLDQALLRCTRTGSEIAVLFIDLDGFKAVNDTLGHAAGDELLCQVAVRLQTGLRASDTAARLAGDEFVLILQQDTEGQLDPAVVAKKLLQSLRQPFQLQAGRAHITASIGIVRSKGEPDSSEGILHRADLAMYHVKQRGKDGFLMIDEGAG